MAANPLRLRPIEVCRLLNSTPLGEVVSEVQLRNHRSRAGMRIGDHKHVNLISYAAWLVQQRHTPRKQTPNQPPPLDLSDLADSAMALAAILPAGTHKPLTEQQHQAIAALLTEPTHKAAAAAIGVHPMTLCRWLKLPAFEAALRTARRKLLDSSLSRAQAASGVAIDSLVGIARHGRREADRIRASVALLDLAARGRGFADPDETGTNDPAAAMQVKDVIHLLSNRIRQIEQSDLNSSEKARLIANLSGTLLNAVNVHEMKVRIDALEAVLKHRPPRKKKR